MLVVIDAREKTPFDLSVVGRWYKSEPLETETGTLQVGDYSLAGLTDKVAVERKSLPDLTQCLGRERPRFERELQRGRALDAFCVVVEADWRSLISGDYTSHLNPHSAAQSVLAFSARYQVPFFFAGTRRAAAYITTGFLLQYLQSARHKWKAILKSHGEAV